MNTSTASAALPQDAQLRLLRTAVLEQIRVRLHGSDQPDQLALINHLDGADDWAGAALLDDTNIALLDHEMTSLRDIDSALLRLNAGLAGVCIECSGSVPAARLAASPTSQTCIACQEMIEKREGFAPSSTI